MTAIDLIDGLSDEEALEAASLLAGRVFGATPDEDLLADVAAASGTDAEEIRAAVAAADVHEVAELARLALIAHAAESSEDVEAVVGAVGEKAFIIETIVIGGLALGLVTLVMTRGKQETVESETIEVGPDGKVSYKREKTTKYLNPGNVIAPILRGVIGGAGSSKPG